jgi:type IV pilus assembly protein PilQ
MKMSGRTTWSLCLALACVLAAGVVRAESASAPPVRVEATVEGNSVRIQATSAAPFEFSTYRPSLSLFVVDLAGVASEEGGGARVLKSDIVSSYRVLQYRSGDRSIVRLEILMRNPVEPRVEKPTPGQLVILFAAEDLRSAKPAVQPSVEVSTARPVKPVEKPAGKVSASNSKAASLIEGVRVTRAEELTQVEVTGNGRLKYDAVRLSNPDRLVLDFAGTKLGTATKSVASSLSPVKGVRLGQFRPDIARVVIDLEKGTSYSVSADGHSLVVAFGGAKRAEQAIAPVVKEVPSAPQLAKTEDATPAAPVAEPAKAEKAAEPAPAPAAKEAAMQLPENLTNSGAALAAPNPANVPAVAPPTPAPAPAPAVSQQAARPAAAQEPQKYTGEPISVNFKDVDLKDFFRLIHEISGLNVVVDPNVKGSLTIVLEDVPWDQALDIALRNNSLDKQLEGNVLRIATKATIKKEAEDKRDLARAELEAVDLETKVRVLSYAKATAMRDTLKRFLSSRGEILADERSNTLIIRDIPTVFPAMYSLIDQLDRKTQQVEIEARVVAASRSFSREVGVRFGFATAAAGGRTVFGGLVGNADFVSPIERPGLPFPQPPLVASGSQGSIPLNTNLGANTPTSGFTVTHSSPNIAVDLIISAAEAKGVGKLLSKPKIITQNNEQGLVKQGTKIPVQTIVNNTISVQFIDAVLQLRVTPQITAEGTVFMTVVVENTAIDNGIPRVSGIPALSTQEANTSVLIPDGGTVVIGGVIISSQRTDVQQVPLFGSIPMIGHLFKKTTVNSQSQELLFFLTPRIIPG